MGRGRIKVGTTVYTNAYKGNLRMIAGDGVAFTVAEDGTNQELDLTVATAPSVNPTTGVGYATGAGGAVTQATNRTTGVTLNKVTGAITTNNASLAAGATAKFTVTNSAVAATDTVVVNIKSGSTTDSTSVRVGGVAAGSFDIVVHNLHASTAETGALVINFAVVKAVAA